MSDHIDYNTVMAELKGMGDWLILPRWFLRVLPRDEALMLAELLNIASMREHDGRVDDGWFRCSSKYLQSCLGVTEKQERLTIRKLKEKGLVESTKRDCPAKRYLRLKIDGLKRLWNIHVRPVF